MKNLKKITSISLSLLLALAVFNCSSDDSDDSTSSDKITVSFELDGGALTDVTDGKKRVR